MDPARFMGGFGVEIYKRRASSVTPRMPRSVAGLVELSIVWHAVMAWERARRIRFRSTLIV